MAVADNTIGDGDGVAPVGNNDMAFGSVACGVSSSKTALVAISRNGNYVTSNVFKKGTTATVTVGSVTGVGLSASVTAPGTIEIPSNWDTVANGTMSPAASATVTINSSTPGAGSGSVTFVATGTKSDDTTPFSRDDVMNVTWTTGSCAPVDSTPPVISYLLSPASPDGSNGWYRGNVTLTWTVTENESPGSLVKTGCVDQSVTADQPATTYSCSATSAGGSAGPVDVTIKRDGSAPTVGVDSVRKADATTYTPDTWSNQDVTVDFGCTDSGPSGVASVTPDPVTKGEGENQTASTTCTDNAGNTASGSVANIDVDKTVPVVTVVSVTNADSSVYTPGTWTNQNVTVDFACTDALSGVASLTPDPVTKGEGENQTAGTTCTDNAGNTANGSVSNIDVDKTAPVIADAGVQSGTVGANGWYVSAVTNRFTASDALSGLSAACDGAFPKNVSTGASQGASVKVASGPCTDMAGNTAAGIDSAAFKIDLTDPTVDITSPAAGLVTIATSLTVSGTAGDTPSGIDTVAVNGLAATFGAGTFSRPAVPLACGANTLTALATDKAGRTSSDSVVVTRLCFDIQFRQPIDQSTGSPVVNAGKYGRVIPVKVIVSLAGGAPLTGGDFTTNGWTLQIGVNSANCSGVASDAVEAYADAGQSGGGTNLFRWTTDQWIYNLDTKAPPAMTMTVGSCHRLDVYISDGVNKVRVSNSTYALFMPTN